MLCFKQQTFSFRDYFGNVYRQRSIFLDFMGSNITRYIKKATPNPADIFTHFLLGQQQIGLNCSFGSLDTLNKWIIILHAFRPVAIRKGPFPQRTSGRQFFYTDNTDSYVAIQQFQSDAT